MRGEPGAELVVNSHPRQNKTLGAAGRAREPGKQQIVTAQSTRYAAWP